MMMILSPLPEVVKAAEKEKKDRMIAKKKAQAAALGKEPSEVELDEDDSDDDEVGLNLNSCHSHIPKVSFKPNFFHKIKKRFQEITSCQLSFELGTPAKCMPPCPSMIQKLSSIHRGLGVACTDASKPSGFRLVPQLAPT